jgi:histidinol-phosphate/aromatic aminotransferase/cobyric acid decarboxylase-like protein
MRLALVLGAAMSLLKQIDPASGQVADSSPDARAQFAAAHQEAAAALHRLEDAFTVSLKAADDRAAALEAQLASLRAELDALARAKAESDAKLAVLAELKQKLAAL